MWTALTREPSRSLGDCELTHLSREPIDVERALDEHEAYRRALADLELTIVHLPPLDDLPDATFVEDAAIAIDDAAIIARPGSPARRPECASIAQALGSVLPLEHIAEPATLDGGDVLRIGDVLYVGCSTRTNHAGLRALAHLVLGHGLRVKAVDVTGALHLKSACTYLGRDVLLAHPPHVSLERFRGVRVLEVDPAEPGAANALAIGDAIVMAEEFPRTIRRVEAAGFRVLATPIGQFLRAEAGVTCLSIVFDSPRALTAPS